MRRQLLVVWCLFCLLCLSLAACAALPLPFNVSAPPHFPPSVTSVHIQRTQSLPRHNWPPLDQTIDKPQAAQLYEATRALPQFPSGVMNCPADFDLNYSLVFTGSDGSQVDVVADPYGCWPVKIDGSDTRRANDAWWNLLAQTLGITRAQLQPTDIYPLSTPS